MKKILDKEAKDDQKVRKNIIEMKKIRDMVVQKNTDKWKDKVYK